MKRIGFSILGMFMLVFPGCIKTGDNIECFEFQPAIAGFAYDLSVFQPTIIIQKNEYIAPDLSDKIFLEIEEGDALITSFCIDYDQQPYANHYMVSGLQYVKLEKGLPRPTTGGESMAKDFDLPVESVEIIGMSRYVMFFYFTHKAAADQKFAYEMTYDRGNTADIPALYIRAKKRGEISSGETKSVGYFYASDMYDFFSDLKNSDNKVSFEIQYKTGVDEEGNDKYEKYYHPNMGSVVEGFVE